MPDLNPKPGVTPRNKGKGGIDPSQGGSDSNTNNKDFYTDAGGNPQFFEPGINNEINNEGKLFPNAYIYEGLDDNMPVTQQGDGKTVYMNIFGGRSHINDYAIYTLTNSRYSFLKVSQMRDSTPSESPDNAGNNVHKPEYVYPETPAIVEYFADNPTLRYRYKDFVYCKWHGIIPNNYLITLRRFLYPTWDNLEFPKMDDSKKSTFMPIAQAVTWLGKETENSPESIMDFEMGYPWSEQTADVWEEKAPKTPGFDDMPFASKYQGLKGTAQFYGAVTGRPYSPSQRGYGNQWVNPKEAFEKTHPNEIYGPINVITKIMKRERGLEFKQEFKITFEYDVMSIGEINAKVAFLDILSNITALCGSVAPFWGGEVITEPNVPTAPFLGDSKLFYQGKYGQYFNSLFNDVSKIAETMKADLMKLNPRNGSEALEKLKQLISGGARLLLDIESSKTKPDAFVARGVLQGNPVGEWHLTIGNPMDPWMVVGNLVLDSAQVKFKYDSGFAFGDFPSSIKVVVNLKHGMLRDISRIQSMYNRGRGKIYRSLPDDAEFTKFFNADTIPGGFRTGNGRGAVTNNGASQGDCDNRTDNYYFLTEDFLFRQGCVVPRIVNAAENQWNEAKEFYRRNLDNGGLFGGYNSTGSSREMPPGDPPTKTKK